MQKFISLFVIITFLSSALLAKVSVIPEYTPLKQLILPLDINSNKNRQPLWDTLLFNIALSAHKNKIPLMLVFSHDEDTFCNSSSNTQLQAALMADFKQSFSSFCQAKSINTCASAAINFRCIDPYPVKMPVNLLNTEYEYSESLYWLRNDGLVSAIDSEGERVYLKPEKKQYPPISTLTKLHAIREDQIISIPLMWNGAADIVTDRFNGNLYLSTRLQKINPKVSKADIERILAEYIHFKSIIWLEPNPWEHTGDTDTIITFAKKPSSSEVHAFLSVHAQSPIRRKHPKGWLPTDFLTLPLMSSKEARACNVKTEDQYFSSVFLLNSLSNPFEIMQDLTIKKLLRAHWSDLNDFVNTLKESPEFYENHACLSNYATQTHAQAYANDKKNYQALLDAGFDKSQIHLLTSPGIYTTSDSTTDDRGGRSYTASYVNGIVLGNSYLMPSYPSFDQPDTQQRKQEELLSAFEELGSADLKALKTLKLVFDHVTPIRSDFLSGGALHCTSIGICK